MIKNVIRVNINLNRDLVRAYDDIAANMCIPRSALMVFALTQYLENKQALSSMSNLEELVGKMENYSNK